ncbi:hypothetical protein M8J77_017118 [Diaphorina citri]|nr:hypothetical protein M8J77_017118 [Diaphorina citri]
MSWKKFHFQSKHSKLKNPNQKVERFQSHAEEEEEEEEEEKDEDGRVKEEWKISARTTIPTSPLLTPSTFSTSCNLLHVPLHPQSLPHFLSPSPIPSIPFHPPTSTLFHFLLTPPVLSTYSYRLPSPPQQ